MTPPIAFFDVDHTLTRRSTGYRFAIEAVSRGILRPSSLAAIPFLYVSYRIGHLGSATLSRERAALRGIPRELLEEVAGVAFKRRIEGDLYPGALELIASLKAAGLRIFLATSSFDIVIRPLARLLGAEGTVASALEFRDGVSTGRFDGVPAFGADKLELAKKTAAREGLSLAECSFYSDSVHDLPLLLAVGEPVAVNPDPRLARVARERGWRTLSFR